MLSREGTLMVRGIELESVHPNVSISQNPEELTILETISEAASQNCLWNEKRVTGIPAGCPVLIAAKNAKGREGIPSQPCSAGFCKPGSSASLCKE